MRDPFARATKSILGLLGKDAFLRGAPAGKVNIEHGVEVYEDTANGQAVLTRSVATIEKIYAPAAGDPLHLVDEEGAPIAPNYKLGRLVQDNGFSARYVAIPVA